MSSFSLETTVTLAVLGTVSVGSIILLLVQTIKQLWPSLEGQAAVWVTFAVSILAGVITFRQLGADFRSIDVWLALLLAACGAFLSAVTQYAFLFKRSVEGLPPPANATAPAEAFTTEDDTEPMTPDHFRRLETTVR